MYKRYVSVEDKGDVTVFEHNKIYLDPTKHEMGKNQLGPEDSLATHAFIQGEFRKVLGRVLTLVDASISDKVQNKALKDIVKNYFAEEYGFLSDTLLDQKVMQRSMDYAWENGQLHTVDIDDALGISKE